MGLRVVVWRVANGVEGVGAAQADGGVAGVLAYVCGVVPAALALEAIGGGGGDVDLVVAVVDVDEFDLGDVEEFFEAGLVFLE